MCDSRKIQEWDHNEDFVEDSHGQIDRHYNCNDKKNRGVKEISKGADSKAERREDARQTKIHIELLSREHDILVFNAFQMVLIGLLRCQE